MTVLNTSFRKLPTAVILVVAVSVGACLLALWSPSVVQSQPTSATKQPSGSADEIAALRAEIERLKGLVPDQAHAMEDVGYYFANLWFAGEKTAVNSL